MWEHFCQERARVKRFRGEAEEERQYLEQVKCCNESDCTHRMMKQGFLALRSGDWEEYKSTFWNVEKATGCAFDRIKEPFEKVAKDDAPAGVQGGVTMSYMCSHCNSFPMGDYVWWISGRKTYKLVVRDLWK